MSIAHALTAASLALVFFSAQAADLAVRVLDRNGQPLADAVVLVDSGVPGAQGVPVLEATIRQEKLRFRPYLTVVNTGAKITFTNQDGWDHHVIVGQAGAGGFYLDPAQNQQLRLAAKVGDTVAQETRSLAKPGAYLLGCHLHSSMRGHVYVADTPWVRLSDAEGKVTLTGVPVGPAQVRIWHPDQVLDGAPVTTAVAASGSAVVVNTQIVALKRR